MVKGHPSFWAAPHCWIRCACAIDILEPFKIDDALETIDQVVGCPLFPLRVVECQSYATCVHVGPFGVHMSFEESGTWGRTQCFEGISNGLNRSHSGPGPCC